MNDSNFLYTTFLLKFHDRTHLNSSCLLKPYMPKFDDIWIFGRITYELT